MPNGVEKNGYILVLTLTMLTLLSIWLILGLQHLDMFSKAISRGEERERRLTQMENVLEATLLFDTTWWNEACFFPEKQGKGSLFTKVIEKGCEITSLQHTYKYLFEDLGIFPCIQVLEDGQSYSTHHFRVYITEQEHARFFVGILEVRYIKKTDLTPCIYKPFKTKEGIANWKYHTKNAISE